MDERNRQELNEIWQNNEKRIEAAQNLKAGAESPVDRLEDLERQQDEIEHEMALHEISSHRRQNAAVVVLNSVNGTEVFVINLDGEYFSSELRGVGAMAIDQSGSVRLVTAPLDFLIEVGEFGWMFP